MKNRHSPAYRELLAEIMDLIDAANAVLASAEAERKAAPPDKSPDELRAQVQEWQEMSRRLRELSAAMIANL